ncbi:hypothetical protein [Pandoraea sp. ISTKB]|uniref:hypothetical protein n=1 Tax=Pandoraea sp. ISTKB TaxID=1586708 RepID=UPI0008474626|nr:hypothetical protein [Pandoraea sp. ISTKB]ODP35061.1 hypothetical protein A9762_11910 [Pandoraea sp. ISTKB]
MNLKKLKSSIVNKVLLATLALSQVEARADSSLQLNNISGTSGAGSMDITGWFNKLSTYFQSGLNLFLIAVALIGIVTLALSIKGIYDANKGNREPPKTAIIGIVVGSCLTAVPFIVGVLRNSVTAQSA